MTTFQIKICGIQRKQEALTAVEFGADALGFVFYEKSPRSIAVKEARQIIQLLPSHMKTVGVFVDERVENVKTISDFCSLDFIQLHGKENPADYRSCQKPMIKAFAARNIGFQKNDFKDSDLVLVDSNIGDEKIRESFFNNTSCRITSGRNVSVKNSFTGSALEAVFGTDVATHRKMAIPKHLQKTDFEKCNGPRTLVSGGLTPENVTSVIREFRPAGVDVSRGVEISPGIKCPSQMKIFIYNAQKAFKEVRHA